MTEQFCFISNRNFLNLNTVTQKYDYIPYTKLCVSTSQGIDLEPLDQQWPLAISVSNQVLISLHKVGERLQKPHNDNFDLDDPYMYETRFNVEYRPLYDPNLKNHYTRLSMQRRLRKLELLSENCDAMCRRKDFFQYLRYLNKIRAVKIAAALKCKVS